MANVQDRGPPSATAVAIGTAIVAGLTGYFIGQASSIGLFGKNDTRGPTARLSREGEAKPDASETDSEVDDDTAEEEDDDDDVQDLGELQTFPGNTEECKLVLVVRSDLGKQAALFEHIAEPR
jgi:PTH2 family peptidyl-tRNA hydrolase